MITIIILAFVLYSSIKHNVGMSIDHVIFLSFITIILDILYGVWDYIRVSMRSGLWDIAVLLHLF